MRINKINNRSLFRFARLLLALLFFAVTVPVYSEYYYEDENGNLVWGHIDSPGAGSDNEGGGGDEPEEPKNPEVPGTPVVPGDGGGGGGDGEEGDGEGGDGEGGTPSTPSVEDELDDAKDKLVPYIEKEEEENDAEEVSEDTDEDIDDIDKDKDGKSDAAEKSEKDAEKDNGDNEKKVGKQTDVGNEDEDGDPVKLASGIYDQKETDISNGNGLAVEIKRRYASQNNIISSFGKGWFTNLDQRIILGTQSQADTVAARYKEYTDNLESSITKMQALIITAYKTTSLDAAKNDLEQKILHCRKNLSDVTNLCTILTNLENEASGYSVQAGITSLKNRAFTLKASIEAKIQTLENDAIKLNRDLGILEDLKNEYNQALTKLEQVRDIKTLSDSRKQRNSKVMFTGMDSFYEETGLDTINIIDEDGLPHLMHETSENSGIWKTKERSEYVECIKDGSGFILKEKDGTQKFFDAEGFITKIADRNGNYIFIKRDEAEKIEYVTNSLGEKYSFVYEGKYISQIKNERDFDEYVLYSYENGFLKTVRDTDGDTVTLVYDSDGYMTDLIKCDQSSISFSYGLVTNEGKKLATSTTNEEKFTEYFDYNGNITTYTDHDGNTTVYEYDDRHRTKHEERADGSVITYKYYSDGNLETINENGSKITYYYDSNGYKESAYHHDQEDPWEYWNYNEYGQLLDYTDRDRVHYKYERDSAGNITEYSKDGTLIYTQRVEGGLVRSRTVYGQNPMVTEYEYDKWGNVEFEKCGGTVTKYKYDKRNRLEKVWINDKEVTSYSYNGSTIVQKDYNGLETTYITNGRKDMTEVIQKDTVTGVVHKTRIEYDHRHLPLKVFQGDGENETLVSSYLYTPEGKVKAEVSYGSECWINLYEYQNGAIHEVKQFKTSAVVEPVETTLTQDILNKLLQQAGNNFSIQTYTPKLLDNNWKEFTVTDALDHQTIFRYDSYGNLVSQTDANGEVRSMTYKPSGRLETEQSSHGGWYKYGYENGMMTSAGEDGAETVETKYNPDGSIKSVEDRYGIVTYYNYDSRGRVSSVQSEAQKVWYEYDGFDRVTKQVIGNTPDEYSAVYYITYEYSEDGRTVTVTEGGKYKSVKELDAFGNVIKQIDGNGNSKSYEYDSQNQVTGFYDGYENKTSYEYNALGNIQRVIHPDGATTEYSYNFMGLLEKVTDDCGTVYTASYDRAGRLVKERTRTDSEKSYVYDEGGRIKEVWCGGELTESYEYGQNSRSVTVKDGNGEDYIYNYDAFGRLVNEKNRLGLEQTYLYDVNGELEIQKNFDNSIQTITYSQNRTTRTVTYSDGSENIFVYDSLGNITEASNTYGMTVYEYDTGARLIYQKDVTTGEEIHFYYDDAGNRIKLLSTNRETVYTYGKNNEVKEIFDNKQRISVKLKYDMNGRETERQFGNGTSETILYDRAGRVTVKAQNSARGELVWAEGYLYGEDGKRTATVDNAGRVTLYEYNKKGQLQTVWYPYSHEMINLLKAEAEENGLPALAELGENRFLPSDIKAGLTPLMNFMQYGLAYSLTNLQIFIKESYGYDRNGNRTSKTTNYGTIEYAYDKENRLLSSGAKGQNFVNYSYDNMGNLLTEESSMKSTKYAYNSQNRLIYCEVTDKSKKEYSQTNYAYDAFGRRVIVQDKGEAALRTLYDGLTFNVIKQSPTFENGLFTDSQNTGIRWSNNGRPTGERYRYIGDEDRQDIYRYIYLDENSYKSTGSRYQGERTQINVNGILAAQSTTEGTQYFTTDLFGSVTTVSDAYGYKLDTYTYDAFGTLVQGSLSGINDFGYLGKQNDPTSKLYNYGYRDYKPQTARFTTVDPIRDGANWFAYVNNDPINYTDPNGLETTDKNKAAIYPTAGNAFNLDFGRDYSNMAVQNFKNGHPILAIIQMLDSACEVIYDLGAAYYCASLLGAGIEGVSTATATGSVVEAADTVKHYGPINKGPLPESLVNTFRSGTYDEVILQSDTTLYRVYGGTASKLGTFWTRTAPTGPLQAQIDLALNPEWGNTCENVVKINVPAGTTIFEGIAASQGNGLLGGANQVIIQNVDPNWVVP